MVANFIGLFCNLSDLKFNLLISASELYPRKKSPQSIEKTCFRYFHLKKTSLKALEMGGVRLLEWTGELKANVLR